MGLVDTQLIWNQVIAVAQNLYIWFLRAVVRRSPAPLLPPGAELKALQAAQWQDGCVSVEIIGPGGVDQLQVRTKGWATCGYNLMSEFGGQHIPAPLKAADLRPDLVVVQNKAFSINYADICIRWGLYESALRYVGWPIVPGFDVAGIVETAGSASGYKPGDRVFGCSLFGGYSSRVVAPRRQLMRMPDDMSFEDAASLPAVAATALHATHIAGLWPSAPLGSSRIVLVHSAAGGVGDMLCQVLHLCGVRVVGIVGSASKIAECKADVVIDKSSEDWAQAARKASPEGFRAIFDANGVGTLSQSYDLLSRNGRLVVYGFHSNLPKCDGGLGTISPLSWLKIGFGLLQTPRFDPMTLTLESKAVLGFNLSFFAEEHELCETYLAQLGEWLTEGKLTAPKVTSFDLAGVRETHAALTSGRTVGKLVVAL